ncbi:2999_t:CDS:2 [Ambispora gerdemannii]|uniref:2999_t:CDS:1 n=1 Tax=Ambispora gerdemannii TaxID=144530 RepID=A0A9N8W0P4_9GLOM|nr:2999_t:CDS:2 [Ambispora gerdemannii]
MPNTAPTSPSSTPKKKSSTLAFLTNVHSIKTLPPAETAELISRNYDLMVVWKAVHRHGLKENCRTYRFFMNLYDYDQKPALLIGNHKLDAQTGQHLARNQHIFRYYDYETNQTSYFYRTNEQLIGHAAQPSNTTNNTKPSDKTALYIGLGIVGLVLIDSAKKIGESAKEAYEDIKEGEDITKVGKKLVKEVGIKEQITELRVAYGPRGGGVLSSIGYHTGTSTFTGKLDLTDFANLEELDCYYNQLTELDLTNCKKLTKLNCYNNKINNLDLSGCPNLTSLKCENNQLTELI